LADRGDAAEARVRAPLREAGEAAVSPPKRSRRGQRACDRDLYGARHRSENCSCRRKQYRGIATRDDTTKRNSLAGVHLAATAILLNCGHALTSSATLLLPPTTRNCRITTLQASASASLKVMSA
ncbi:MAG: hypothetical protein AVDCRST_MAG18-3573, partial [uncultured Thermomicrobiales bacterium]